MDPILNALAHDVGIHFMAGATEFQPDSGIYLRRDNSGALACDAQPSLVTVGNSGIPAYLTQYVDPKLIETLVTPMKATQIVGSEQQLGNWLTETASFVAIESVGQTASYGDYSENGNAGANATFPQRQSYHYQVITQWGEKELARADLAVVSYANRLNISSALILNKFQNKTYFYGVAGLQNYGLLNDPALTASIVPTTKAAGGTAWANATALEIANDVLKLFGQLQTQSGGTIDRQTKLTLAISPTSDVWLGKTVEFGLNVADFLKKSLPNLRIETAVEYTTGSGELAQLIADEVDGQRTAETAFTEKMRAHPIVVGISNFKQKKSQGTWGTVIFRPFLIAGMIGL